MPNTIENESAPRNQYRLLAIIFVGIVIITAGGYFAFLKLNFSPLYQGLTTEDAAIIVEELETREVRYKLRNGGADILVPFTQVASVRLAIIGSEAPTRNLSGFELFNDSQMGLTDFDQKIKYQRALQGELSRTIMMMEDVKSARVHLAIPERALFRASQSIPKAAVTIISNDDKQLSKTRIVGIQQLVAASIPELITSRVVVINSFGEVISERPSAINPVKPNHDKLENAYNKKAMRALNEQFPGRFSKVSVNAKSGKIQNLNYIVPMPDLPTPRLKTKVAAKNSYSLDVFLETKTPLNDEETAKVKDVLKASIYVDEALGDNMEFSVNTKKPAQAENVVATNTVIEMPTKTEVMAGQDKAGNNLRINGLPSERPPSLLGEHGLFYIALGFLLLLLLTLVVRKIRNRILSPAEHLDFAEQLKLKLQAQKEQSNA